MDLWDKQEQSDIYIPYLRVTNSYNKSRALRFDIGFCREVCLNGLIFDPETIKSAYSHLKREFTDDGIPFALSNGKIGKLVEDFKSYTTKLKNYHIPRAQALDLLRVLFRIKDKGQIKKLSEKEDREEYDALLRVLDWRLDKYIRELGENSYALFNAITDIASHSIDNNRYFRRDMNTMQRLAGDWIHSFQREVERPDFDITNYLEQLKKVTERFEHLDAGWFYCSGAFILITQHHTGWRARGESLKRYCANVYGCWCLLRRSCFITWKDKVAPRCQPTRQGATMVQVRVLPTPFVVSPIDRWRIGVLEHGFQPLP